MATKRTDGPRPTMIHCEYCGEDYASTYKIGRASCRERVSLCV